jgi:hypothetical protein
MDKKLVEEIITETLKSGTKTPGIFQMGKALSIKKDLGSSEYVSEVCAKLINRKTDICDLFGLTEVQVRSCVDRLMTETTV